MRGELFFYLQLLDGGLKLKGFDPLRCLFNINKGNKHTVPFYFFSDGKELKIIIRLITWSKFNFVETFLFINLVTTKLNLLQTLGIIRKK